MKAIYSYLWYKCDVDSRVVGGGLHEAINQEAARLQEQGAGDSQTVSAFRY